MKIKWTGTVTQFGGLTITLARIGRMRAPHALPVPWGARIDFGESTPVQIESTDHATEAEAQEWTEQFVERISSGAVKQAIAAEREAFIDAIYAERERCRQGGDPEGDGALRLFEQRLRAQWGEGG